MNVIPILDFRQQSPASAKPAAPIADYPAVGHLADRMGRPLRDLRISVTDRCNFRCVYCMPKEIFDKDYRFLPHSALLSFEEIERVAKIFVAHGVEKIRLTGGEPLLRKNLERLVELLRKLQTPDGRPLDLTLTTNGALLAKKAQALKDAGLDRVTVSLDSLDDANFKRMNDADFPLSQVLEGIDAAHQAGLGPIKINMVVKKGVNDHEILTMARHFKNTPYILRFIEYMDVGSSNGWRMDEVLPSAEVIARINEQLPISPTGANYPGETAKRWRYNDGGGEVGVISSVSHAFCGDCNRTRLSTEGKLFTCLFATSGYDLRALLRDNSNSNSNSGDNRNIDQDIINTIGHIWHNRADRYSELRAAQTGNDAPEKIGRKVEMSYIGG
ncbi:MAG: molybdenum cofactor biosynthesis protein MoeA [Herbaspirillum sp.]|jgi:cyclic pyranopterin phosphate synthase|nr:molybdenum cofactor biosynthesis protein MoeA [Herbaspirillum sp.]